MGIVLYNIFLLLFRAGIRLAALFSPKAKQWLSGRQGLWENLTLGINKLRANDNDRKVAWVHCASLGEFEQGRPVIERLRELYPGCAILLTFFSPSGYEIRKNYPGADVVTYLPMDSAGNAKRWIDTVRPDLVIFVKYEFWYYYLENLNRNKIPTLLISAIFRRESVFFKWYGGLHREMLGFFRQLFVQNDESLELLKGIGAGHKTTVAGDSRFDRVAQIAAQFTPIPNIETFINDHKALVAGSTWPPDEDLLRKTVSDKTALKLIIAPHEISSAHIAGLRTAFPGASLYSEINAGKEAMPGSNVLIIDNIGMLSRLYHYAYITYIGGGFGKGIHNTLEAAVHGKPVLFGPAYHKFQEAKDLIKVGAGNPVATAEECDEVIDQLLNNENMHREACEQAKEYVREKTGATGKILGYIQENRLLTR